MRMPSGRTFSLLLAGFGLLTAAVRPLAAQGRPGSVEITLGGGGYFGGTFYSTVVNNHYREVELSTTGSYGAAIAYNFNRAIGIEFGYSHAEPSLQYTHPFDSNTTDLGTVKIDNYELNANFAFGGYRIVGYFSMGAGATHFGVGSGSLARNDTRFTGNVGGGCKFYFGDHFALRVDGRIRATDTNVTTTNTYCDYYGVCYHYSDNWYYSGSATGGVVFAF